MGLDENGAHLLQCVTRLLRIPAPERDFHRAARVISDRHVALPQLHSTVPVFIDPSSSSVCTWHR